MVVSNLGRVFFFFKDEDTRRGLRECLRGGTSSLQRGYINAHWWCERLRDFEG